MKKACQFFLLLVAPIILFHTALEALLDHTVIKYAFKDFKSSYSKDFCLGLLSLLVLYYYTNRPKKYIPSLYRAGIIWVAGLTYLFYRLYEYHWVFVSLKVVPGICYADILLLAASGEIFLLLRSCLSRSSTLEAGSAFYGNRPISRHDEDRLGYQDYANVIADRLNGSRFDEAFAVGINGKWGSGKTSFLNLVKQKIDKDRRILIDFKPWNAHEPQAILKDFFETVQLAISPYHATLANEIRNYGKKLVELHSNSFSQSLSASFDLLTGYNGSLSNQYEQINQGLRKIDQQLIICIDDLDRLDKKEINEVIRLIRNTANFYNTVFLAAYDREYLLSAIQQINSHNYKHFLEKIFQLEINLPGFNMNILKEYLSGEIIKVFGEGHEAECKAAVNELFTYKVNILGDWVASIRDINHILNSHVVNAVQIKEEVLISDMLKLELLRYRYPLVYSDLFYKSERWLDADAPVFDHWEPVYKLKTGGQHQLNISIDLKDPEGPYQLRQIEVEKIIKLLNMLFKPSFIRTGQEYLALKYPLNFSKYFHYSLKKNQLSNKDFYEARNSDLAVFKEKIKEWLQNNYAIQLHRLFKRLDDIADQADYEKIIRGIIYMSNTELPKELYSPVSYYAFQLDNFAGRLNDSEFRISHRIYHDQNAVRGKFKQFVKSLFEAASFTYFYEAQVLYYFKTNFNSHNTPLTRQEIDSYLLRYFEDYLSKVTNFDYDDWRFFDYLKTGSQLEYEGNQLFAPAYEITALSLFKGHIAKHLDDFLLLMISRDLHEKGRYTVSDYCFQLFLTMSALRDFLAVNQEGSAFVIEFTSFLDAYEQAGRQYVIFDFKTIPVLKDEN